MPKEVKWLKGCNYEKRCGHKSAASSAALFSILGNILQIRVAPDAIYGSRMVSGNAESRPMPGANNTDYARHACRFVMAWSEGTPSHQVRAQSLNADGSPSGPALALSAAGINAGQPQIAVGPDGRGVVAFLAAKGKAYEVHATPVACAAK